MRWKLLIKSQLEQSVDYFLGAPTHLYNWLCPLVCRSVCLSAGRLRIRSTIHTAHLIGLLGLVVIQSVRRFAHRGPVYLALFICVFALLSPHITKPAHQHAACD